MIHFKKVGDNLSAAEYNGVVSILRDNIIFTENIEITTSNVVGEYGNYLFNFNEATILDEGILITNETLSSIGTVKLLNPIFPNSNYFLDLNVYSIEDYTIKGLDKSEMIVTNLTVKLKKDTEISIPFNTLDMNNIIGFNAVIRIKHDEIVISNIETLTLSVSKINTKVDELVLINIEYKDSFERPLSDRTVLIYCNGTLLREVITDSDGTGSFSHSFNEIGSYMLSASESNITSNLIEITTEKYTTNLSYNYRSEGFVGTNLRRLYVVGYLKNENDEGISNANIRLFVDNSQVGTTKTGNNGYFEATLEYGVPRGSKRHLQLKFDETYKYKAVETPYEEHTVA